MNWRDYKKEVSYKMLSIGILHGRYVLERKIQSGMVSDFYVLYKHEFDSFMDWCDKEEVLMHIYVRKAWMRGYFGFSEFRMLQEYGANNE